MVMVYGDLGTAVNQAFEDMKGDFTEVFFKEQIAGPMSLVPSSVREYIHNYKLGNIYGSASSTPMNRQDRLDKTSVFLWGSWFF
jgi:hypothetical protein